MKRYEGIEKCKHKIRTYGFRFGKNMDIGLQYRNDLFDICSGVSHTPSVGRPQSDHLSVCCTPLRYHNNVYHIK
ncbi:MAG: hypothetical protein MUF58_18545 [Arcicella sp.]|nr:hypothetical protein [Arcicella sp.]